MTDDIVTQLREIANADVYRADISVSKLYEAADEIERLRAENDGLKIRIHTLMKALDKAVHGD